MSYSVVRFLLGFFATILLGLFIYGVVVGAQAMSKENTSIREGCKETELVVIGNKGHATKVYDCSGKDDG